MPTCLDGLTGSPPFASPFGSLLAFDFYDGPISGVVRCSGTGGGFHFQMVAWDNERERRVFVLRGLPSEEMESAIRLLEAVETPRWPEWWLATNRAEQDKKGVSEIVDRVTAAAGRIEWLVVSTRLLESIELVKRIRTREERATVEHMARRSTDTAEVSDAPFSEWIELIVQKPA